MRLWTPIIAVLSATGLVSSQATSAYTDPDTGIIYQQYRTNVGGGYSFGLTIPTTPSNEFIGRLVGPTTGWSGVSLGGPMPRSLLLTIWADDDKIRTSFRHTSSYIDPEPHAAGPVTIPIHTVINETHFSYTFLCKNCVSWVDGGMDLTSQVAVLGWAMSLDPIQDPGDIDGVIPYHEAGMGQYACILMLARQEKYEEWAALAATPTGIPEETVTSTPTPTASPTEMPVPTEVLGEVEYIVVGGGAGGLIAAGRLAEAGKKVVLIERGPPATYEHGGRIYPAWLEGKKLTRFDVPGLCNEIWRDSKGIACEDVDQMAGCVLGGGTAVNAGMFFPPQDRDWDENFPNGWKSTDMAAATKKLLARIPGTDTPSMDGNRYVQDPYLIWGGAMGNAGWTQIDINKNPNKKSKHFGHAPFMFSGGQRGGPLATYLTEAKKRNNFSLQTETMVRRINRNGTAAVSVEVFATSSKGKTGIYKLTPGGRVILSAGAFGTSKILFRSGIGPKDQLKIVAASAIDGPSFLEEKDWILSPVGYNVIDHTATEMVISHPNITNVDYYGAYNKPSAADAAAYLDHRAGNLASAAPGIPLVVYDQIVGADGITRQLQWTIRGEGSMGESGSDHATGSMYLGTGSTTRGRIVIKSDLGMTVGVSPWVTSGEDKAAIVKGIDNMLTVLRANAGDGITVLQPVKGQTAQQYVDAYAQGRGTNHWMGSAKMGLDDGTKQGGERGSVVGIDAKVYGTSNIFVVDASIFPGQVATNPSAPIMIAAERAIELILANPAVGQRWWQCGGQNWTGPTLCEEPYTCVKKDDFYSQCL